MLWTRQHSAYQRYHQQMIRNLPHEKELLPGSYRPQITLEEAIFRPRLSQPAVLSVQDATMTRFSLAMSLAVVVRQPGLASDSAHPVEMDREAALGPKKPILPIP